MALAASWGHLGRLGLPPWTKSLSRVLQLFSFLESLLLWPRPLHMTPAASTLLPTLLTQRCLVPPSSTPHTPSLLPSFQTMTSNSNKNNNKAAEKVLACAARLSSEWFIHTGALMLKHTYGGSFPQSPVHSRGDRPSGEQVSHIWSRGSKEVMFMCEQQTGWPLQFGQGLFGQNSLVLWGSRSDGGWAEGGPEPVWRGTWAQGGGDL